VAIFNSYKYCEITQDRTYRNESINLEPLIKKSTFCTCTYPAHDGEEPSTIRQELQGKFHSVWVGGWGNCLCWCNY